MMMMVPCGQTIEDNRLYRLYYCSSSRRNTRYLGLYENRSIRDIGEIKKRVKCHVDLEANTVIPDDLEPSEKQRILYAAQAAKNRGWDISHDHKFYICDEIVPTDFRKRSAGGIQGHRYLDLGPYFGDGDLPGVEEIADRLRSESWD